MGHTMVTPGPSQSPVVHLDQQLFAYLVYALRLSVASAVLQVPVAGIDDPAPRNPYLWKGFSCAIDHWTGLSNKLRRAGGKVAMQPEFSKKGWAQSFLTRNAHNPHLWYNSCPCVQKSARGPGRKRHAESRGIPLVHGMHDRNLIPFGHCRRRPYPQDIPGSQLDHLDAET